MTLADFLVLDDRETEAERNPPDKACKEHSHGKDTEVLREQQPGENSDDNKLEALP